MALSAGTQLGPYEIISLLGAGGMGEVYRAHDPRLERDVAVKVLPSVFFRDPDRLRRFKQEAKAAATLNHPNILAIHDVGSTGDTYYLVSELLEGETLRQRMHKGLLPLEKARALALQIVNALSAAHSKGVVHRDLKPENLFLSCDGNLKILDFGLAKLVSPDSRSVDQQPTVTQQTAIGMVMGTPGYMSPEQARGLVADSRSDIFAVGAVLYEMLSGKRAFPGPTSADVISAILHQRPTPLSAIVPIVPIALSRIVERCLEKNASDRFQSARELAAALELVQQAHATSQEARILHQRSLRGYILFVVAVLAMAALVVYHNQLRALFTSMHRRPTVANQIDPEQMKFTRIANTRDWASISSDGKYLAYISAEAGKQALVIDHLATRSRTNVVPPADHVFAE